MLCSVLLLVLSSTQRPSAPLEDIGLFSGRPHFLSTLPCLQISHSVNPASWSEKPETLFPASPLAGTQAWASTLPTGLAPVPVGGCGLTQAHRGRRHAVSIFRPEPCRGVWPRGRGGGGFRAQNLPSAMETLIRVPNHAAMESWQEHNRGWVEHYPQFCGLP